MAVASHFDADILFGANAPFLSSLSSSEAYVYSLYWAVTTLSMVEANEVRVWAAACQSQSWPPVL